MTDEAFGDGSPKRPFLVAAGTPGNHRLGLLMKDLRERSGLSPMELAEQANVHVSFVRGIERGAQAPSATTARSLLALVKEQDRVHWLDGEQPDLLISDRDAGHDVAFVFKAKVKGQNRRGDGLDGARAGLQVLAQAMRQLGIGEPPGDSDLLPSDAVGLDDGQQHGLASSDRDATFGRIVRLLAEADGETLRRIEALLERR